jgi:cell division protein FtsQ
MSPSSSVSTLNRRPASRRRSGRRLLVVLTVVVALVGFGSWVVFLSSWLAADTVAVAGTTATLSTTDVESAAQVPLGTPLIRVDLSRIRTAVAALPAVKTVAVRRVWPHTVAITVTERQPVACRYHDGAWQLLDLQGVAFRAAAARPPGLPVLAVDASSPDHLLAQTAEVAAALPAELASQTRRITATTMDSIELHLKRGEVVSWGSAADSQRKVEVLTALMVNGKAAQYDVSVPSQPTTSK